MSTGAEKDCSPRLVSLMMGVAIGIPLCIIGGLFLQQTGWGLILGPFLGLAIGVGLGFMASGKTASAGAI
jgi:uncharacterized membrane protein (UPF0136 family)